MAKLFDGKMIAQLFCQRIILPFEIFAFSAEFFFQRK